MKRNRRRGQHTWFRCPCGFEAAGDPDAVESIFQDHDDNCLASRKTMGDQLRAAVYERD